MIYGGPGDRNVERVARQLKKFSLFPLIGLGLGLRQPVHVDDLATAAILAAESPNTVSKTYNLGGAEIIPFKDMIKKIARANNSNVRFVSIPLPVARTGLILLSPLPQFRGIPLGSLERMSKDLVFDLSEAKAHFSYDPRPFMPPSYL
jgi:nucleoside-diphosphate-sugar epimerase